MSDVLNVTEVMAESAVFNLQSTITQLSNMLQSSPKAVVAVGDDIEHVYKALVDLRIRVAVAENNIKAAACS